ncbi:MAG: hypothetical protein A3K00_08775 [Gallionellales bacterium RIFOXYD2_FULL_52_7]|nr:MAG: hypothetical protein A3K00_08775 [Gallionellales bacterium RIFOXYD2_FULL_52_7]
MTPGSENTASADNQESTSTAVQAQAKLKPTEYIAMPSNMAAAPVVAVAASVIVEAVTPVVAEVVTETVAAPVVNAFVAVETKSAGLVQIETAPHKVSTEVPVERPQPVIRRRPRQLEVYVENEPLVQIETQNTKS